jgi:3-hydroxyisobutyrate dehydrogenase-like beta-hydroxyacid dehydrogenase
MSDRRESSGKVVGFIGTGTMGAPMASCILATGHELVVHDARREAAEPLLDAGARWAASAAEVARQAKLVCTSLPGPAEVEEVVTGAAGLLAGAAPGTIHADLSTISFAAARDLARREADGGVRFLDSPVSGGVFKAATAKRSPRPSRFWKRSASKSSTSVARTAPPRSRS